MLRNLFKKLRGASEPTIISSSPEPEPEPEWEPYALSLLTHHASTQDIKSVGSRDLKIALDECVLAQRTVRPVVVGDLTVATGFAGRIRRELHRRGEI